MDGVFSVYEWRDDHRTYLARLTALEAKHHASNAQRPCLLYRGDSHVATILPNVDGTVRTVGRL